MPNVHKINMVEQLTQKFASSSGARWSRQGQ